MASDAQNKANQDNSQRSTGPKTAEGKAIVRRNPIKTGATTQQLINADEATSFKEIVNDLKKAYPSKNPLIKMQIDRIAKIKIQLDRIHGLIDQAFDEANLPNNIAEHLMDILQLDDNQRTKLIEDGKHDSSSPIDIKKIEVAQALIKSNYLECKTHEELLNRCHDFCEYLYNQAIANETNLSTYVKYLSSTPTSQNQLESSIAMKIQKILESKGISSEKLSLQEAVSAIPLESLLHVASKVVSYSSDISDTDLKILMYRALESSHTIPAQPNFDTLNNLYRYQTTLQKQLSTTMGELLALDAKEHR